MFRSKNGFSLAEVMVAMGLLGGLSLSLVHMAKNQSVIQKKAEASFEINTMSNLIVQNLLITEACNSTIGVGANIVNGLSISDLKNRKGDVLFNTTDIYGNNQIKINSIKVQNLTLSAGAGTNQYGQLDLEVEFEKVSKIISGIKVVKKSFPISIEVNSSGNLVKCNSSTENAIESAKQESCTSIGGTFDVATDKCNLSSYPQTLSDSEAVSSQALSDFFDGQLLTHQDPRYINVDGDTMTGSLKVNNTICINGDCRSTFANQSCPAGQVVRSVNTDGTVVCGNVTCPDANTFYVGIDASGLPICKAFPTNTCSANQYVAQVNSDGSVVCKSTPAGTNKDCTPGAIQKIDADGNHTCTLSSGNVFGKSCAVGQYLRGFTALGDPICESMAAGGAALTCATATEYMNTGYITNVNYLATLPEWNHACDSGFVTTQCVATPYVQNAESKSFGSVGSKTLLFSYAPKIYPIPGETSCKINASWYILGDSSNGAFYMPSGLRLGMKFLHTCCKIE